MVTKEKYEKGLKILNKYDPQTNPEVQGRFDGFPDDIKKWIDTVRADVNEYNQTIAAQQAEVNKPSVSYYEKYGLQPVSRHPSTMQSQGQVQPQSGVEPINVDVEVTTDPSQAIFDQNVKAYEDYTKGLRDAMPQQGNDYLNALRRGAVGLASGTMRAGLDFAQQLNPITRAKQAINQVVPGAFNNEAAEIIDSRTQEALERLADSNPGEMSKGLLGNYKEKNYKGMAKVAFKQALESSPQSFTAMAMTIGGNPLLGSAMIGLPVYGNKLSEIENKTFSEKDYTESSKRAEALYYAIAEAGSEVLGDVATMGLAKLPLDAAKKIIMNKIKQKAIMKIVRGGATFLTASTMEGFEGGVSKLADNIFPALDGTKSLKDIDLLEGVPESIVSEAAASVFMQSPVYAGMATRELSRNVLVKFAQNPGMTPEQKIKLILDDIQKQQGSQAKEAENPVEQAPVDVTPETVLPDDIKTAPNLQEEKLKYYEGRLPLAQTADEVSFIQGEISAIKKDLGIKEIKEEAKEEQPKEPKKVIPVKEITPEMIEDRINALEDKKQFVTTIKELESLDNSIAKLEKAKTKIEEKIASDLPVDKLKYYRERLSLATTADEVSFIENEFSAIKKELSIEETKEEIKGKQPKEPKKTTPVKKVTPEMIENRIKALEEKKLLATTAEEVESLDNSIGKLKKALPKPDQFRDVTKKVEKEPEAEKLEVKPEIQAPNIESETQTVRGESKETTEKVEEQELKDISVTDKSPQDFSQKIKIKGDKITATNFWGKDMVGSYSFNVSEWESAKKRSFNPDREVRNFVIEKSGLDDSDPLHSRIIDAQVRGIKKAINDNSTTQGKETTEKQASPAETQTKKETPKPAIDKPATTENNAIPYGEYRATIKGDPIKIQKTSDGALLINVRTGKSIGRYGEVELTDEIKVSPPKDTDGFYDKAIEKLNKSNKGKDDWFEFLNSVSKNFELNNTSKHTATELENFKNYLHYVVGKLGYELIFPVYGEEINYSEQNRTKITSSTNKDRVGNMFMPGIKKDGEVLRKAEVEGGNFPYKHFPLYRKGMKIVYDESVDGVIVEKQPDIATKENVTNEKRPKETKTDTPSKGQTKEKTSKTAPAPVKNKTKIEKEIDDLLSEMKNIPDFSLEAEFGTSDRNKIATDYVTGKNENFSFPEMAKLDNLKQIFAPTYEQILQDIIDSSNDPDEIYNAWAEERMMLGDDLTPWQRIFIEKKYKINRKDFAEHADRKYITASIAKSWFASSSEPVKGIDVLGQEMAQYNGGEDVSPSDIIDLIMEYPTGYQRKTNDKMTQLEERMKDVTGKGIKAYMNKKGIDYNKVPSGYASTGEFNNALKQAGMGLPELLATFQAMGGNVKVAVLSDEKGGDYNPKTKTIRINANTFDQASQEVQRALKIFAHELGHAVDDYAGTLTKKGDVKAANLQGKLRALQGFIDNFYVVMGNPETVIAERRKLKQRISALKAKEKKGKNTKGQIDTLQSKLDEIESGMFMESRIRKEMYDFSKTWRPFDEANAPEKFIKYRKKASEIFADFFSGMMVMPEFTSEQAPTATRLFIESLSKRGEFAKAYIEFQNMMAENFDNVVAWRDKNLSERFTTETKESDDMIRAKAKQRQKGFLYTFKRAGVSKGAAITSIEGVRGVTNKSDYLLTDIMHYELRRSRHQRFIADKFFKILDDAKADGINYDLIDKLLFSLRNAYGERSDIANPDFMQIQESIKEIEFLEKEHGKELIVKARKHIEDLQNFWVNDVLDYCKDLFSPELLAEIKQNRSLGYVYAPYFVRKYFEDYQMSAGINKQIGTAENIISPLHAMHLKMTAMINAAHWNKLKLQAEKKLFLKHPSDFPEAKIEYSYDKDGNRYPKIIKPMIYKEVLYLKENGETRAYQVDRDVVDGLIPQNKTSQDMAKLFKLLGAANRPIRYMLVTGNIGFQIASNLYRDLGRTQSGLSFAGKNISTLGLAYYYLKHVNRAFKHARGIDDPVMMKLIDNNAYLQLSETIRAYLSESEIDALNVLDRDKYLSTHQSDVDHGAVVNAAIGALKGLSFIGNVVEPISKLAAYDYLKDEVGEGKIFKTEEDLYLFIAEHVGTPHFGYGGTFTPATNQILMFSNIMIRDMVASYELLRDPKTRPRVIAKMAIHAVGGAAIMFLLSSGVIPEMLSKFIDEDDEEEKKNVLLKLSKFYVKAFRSIPEYYKLNYHCIPIGFDDETKTVTFISIPMTELYRIPHAIAWKLLGTTKDPSVSKFVESSASIAEFAAGNLPSMSPVISNAVNWSVAMRGGNPVDPFRQKNIFTRDQMELGIKHKIEPMLDWSLNSVGVRTKELFDGERKTGTMEKVLAFVTGYKRLIRQTSAGYAESIQNDPEVQESLYDAAKKRVYRNEYAEKAAKLHIKTCKANNIDPYSPEAREGLIASFIDIREQLVNEGVISKEKLKEDSKLLEEKYIYQVIKKHENDPFINQLNFAKTNNQKAAIMLVLWNGINESSPKSAARRFSEKAKIYHAAKLISPETMEIFEAKYYPKSKYKLPGNK